MLSSTKPPSSRRQKRRGSNEHPRSFGSCLKPAERRSILPQCITSEPVRLFRTTLQIDIFPGRVCLQHCNHPSLSNRGYRSDCGYGSLSCEDITKPHLSGKKGWVKGLSRL